MARRPISLIGITRQAFAKTLEQKNIVFERHQGADARELQRDQHSRWRDLIAAIERGLRADVEPNLAAGFAARSQQALQSFDVGVYEEDKEIVVRSEVSILREDAMSHLIPFAEAEPWFALAGVLSTSGDVIMKRAQKEGASPPHEIRTLMSDPRMAIAMHDWIAVSRIFPMIKSVEDEYERAASKVVGEFESNLKRLTAHSKAGADAVADAKVRATEQLRSFEDDAGRLRKEIEGQWEQFHTNATADFEATKKRVTEQSILSGAHSLWRSKARVHGWSFWLGFVALGILVGSAAVTIILYGPAYLASLPRKADGDISYAIVALLTITAIGIGWMLRFLGRFVVDNMVMQADAVQRRTMLQTYLALVGDKEAGMEQADRTLILNAIFRPLPGHQSEDVAPPTLAELVKSAAPVGKG